MKCNFKIQWIIDFDDYHTSDSYSALVISLIQCLTNVIDYAGFHIKSLMGLIDNEINLLVATPHNLTDNIHLKQS